MLKKNFNFAHTSFFKSNILLSKNILELTTYLKKNIPLLVTKDPTETHLLEKKIIFL